MKHAKIIAIITLLISAAATAYAVPIRSITTLGVDQYSYDDTGYSIGEVAIAQLESGLSLVAKFEYEELPYKSKTKGMAGIVFPVFPYSYMETSYGISIDDEDALTHHLLIDLYYERARYLILSGLKADLSAEGYTLLPSIGARWNDIPRLSLWGKYTTSFDSESGFDHSFWGETEYTLIDKLHLKLGGTVGTYHNDTDSSQQLEYSGLAGFAVIPASTLRISYQYEYLVRQEYEMGSHTIVADIRF